MKLYVVRHGETIENAANIIQGQLPGHLNALGLEQVSATAVKLKDVAFDAIYCSDLQRCVETAAIICKFHPDQTVTYSEQLRERKGGSFEGKPLDMDFWQSLPGTEYTRHYPGGESWDEVRLRVLPFLNEIYAKHPDDTVLFVAHGGIVRGIRALIAGVPLDQLENDGNPNAGVWTFDVSGPLQA
jgi:broad specificity phosphatase PhoE